MVLTGSSVCILITVTGILLPNILFLFLCRYLREICKCFFKSCPKSPSWGWLYRGCGPGSICNCIVCQISVMVAFLGLPPPRHLWSYSILHAFISHETIKMILSHWFVTFDIDLFYFAYHVTHLYRNVVLMALLLICFFLFCPQWDVTKGSDFNLNFSFPHRVL